VIDTVMAQSVVTLASPDGVIEVCAKTLKVSTSTNGVATSTSGLKTVPVTASTKSVRASISASTGGAIASALP